ncbi:DUF5665 domain-containing protein [Brevibacillus daliensis]|uniref:DUF5665 domain-containing protein n=1 Tax=Brevibacillus daliensis TaxID=2892995 RepID=UPI001E5BC14C|nr:DUF5665 domain-containing protein [Brevibacillus daliensis]
MTPEKNDKLLQELEHTKGELEKVLDELKEIKETNRLLQQFGLFFEEIRLADMIRNYTTPKRLLWTNFVAGLAKGLGLTIGTAIVLAFFGALLSKFLSLPIIGDYIRQIIDYVQSYQ